MPHINNTTSLLSSFQTQSPNPNCRTSESQPYAASVDETIGISNHISIARLANCIQAKKRHISPDLRASSHCCAFRSIRGAVMFCRAVPLHPDVGAGSTLPFSQLRVTNLEHGTTTGTAAVPNTHACCKEPKLESTRFRVPGEHTSVALMLWFCNFSLCQIVKRVGSIDEVRLPVWCSSSQF